MKVSQQEYEIYETDSRTIWVSVTFGHIFDYTLADGKVHLASADLVDEFLPVTKTYADAAKFLDIDYTKLIQIHPHELKYYGDSTTSTIAEKKCSCDLVTILLPYGCQCGGK
jgi:hypothetical protein